jgi:hypothetical protein
MSVAVLIIVAAKKIYVINKPTDLIQNLCLKAACTFVHSTGGKVVAFPLGADTLSVNTSKQLDPFTKKLYKVVSGQIALHIIHHELVPKLLQQLKNPHAPLSTIDIIRVRLII